MNIRSGGMDPTRITVFESRAPVLSAPRFRDILSENRRRAPSGTGAYSRCAEKSSFYFRFRVE